MAYDLATADLDQDVSRGEARRPPPGKASMTQRMPASARAIARAVAAAMNVSPDADAHVDRALGGGGRPLPDGVRGRFERSLGVDLGGVRVHADGAAATAAAAVGARAFAFGDDVVMGAGEYNPDTTDGARLLAHEVAHTVQQRGAAATPQYQLTTTTPGDAAEVEADRAADAMLAGDPFAIGAAGPAVARLARWADGRGAQAVLAAIARADLPAIRQLILALETARANNTPAVALGDRTQPVALADLHELDARARARFDQLSAQDHATPGPQARDGVPDASLEHGPARASDDHLGATPAAQAAASSPTTSSAPHGVNAEEHWADVGGSIQMNRVLRENRTPAPGYYYLRKVEVTGVARIQQRGGASPSLPHDNQNHPGGRQRVEATGIGYNTRTVGQDNGVSQVREQVAERYQVLNRELDLLGHSAVLTGDGGIQATGGTHESTWIGSLGLTGSANLTFTDHDAQGHSGPNSVQLTVSPELRIIDRGNGTRLPEFMRMRITAQVDYNRRLSATERITGRFQLVFTFAPGLRAVAWIERTFGQAAAAAVRRTSVSVAEAAAQTTANTAEHAAERGAANATEQATENAARRGAVDASERVGGRGATQATEQALGRGATEATEHAALRGGTEAALEGGARVGARGALARGAAALGTVAEVLGFLDLPLQVTIWNVWMWQHAWEAGRRDASLARQVQRDLFDCCMSYAQVMTGGTPRGGRPGADGAHAAEGRIARAVAAGYTREQIFEATRTYQYAGRYGLPAWYQEAYVTMAPRARAAGAQQQGFVDVVGAAIDAVDQGGYGYRAFGGW